MPWQLDPAHTRVECLVKYMGIIDVRSEFRGIDARFNFEDDDPTRWSVEATIDAASFHSWEERRDNKIRGPEYFAVERFPTLDFTSKRVERDGDRYRLIGDLTIHGITREVVLDASYNGEATNARGNVTRGFTATTTIKRSDFGIHTSSSDGSDRLEADEVRIHLEIGVVRRE